MFSRSGEFLRTFGAAGSGPGELGAFYRFFGIADSLFVRELTGEVEVFDSSGRWVRTFRPAGGASDLEVFDDATLLDSSPFQILLSRRDGTSLRSLGPQRPQNQVPLSRHVTTTSGRVWSIWSNYLIEGMDTEGRIVATRQHDLAQFEERKLLRKAGFWARVVDAVAPTDDLLYVLVSRQKLGAHVASATEGGDGSPRMLAAEEAIDRYDHFLDVVRTDDLSLRYRLQIPDGFVGGFAAPNELYTVEEVGLDSLALQVWRVRFTDER